MGREERGKSVVQNDDLRNPSKSNQMSYFSRNHVSILFVLSNLVALVFLLSWVWVVYLALN